ncbi:hypothetical protein TcasGA2_TC032267 [Tribolium castaneum]|uniref:Uncharacterized protein n=1 Tax=Tribolium castaneum TaxID=7070 RepID=A0A139WM42_TRICA|nr:hypothetical protein TcasGA2_TC032267 [Tribolium castaneum]
MARSFCKVCNSIGVICKLFLIIGLPTDLFKSRSYPVYH